MHQSITSTSTSKKKTALQCHFEAILPQIERTARARFADIRDHSTREDNVAEVVAMCWRAFCRLNARGKDPAQFVHSFTVYMVRHRREGRRLCRRDSSLDALSPLSQRMYGYSTLHFDHGNHGGRTDDDDSGPNKRTDDSFANHLTDDTLTPIPDQVAFRLDWQGYLATLTERDREMMKVLAEGNSVVQTAKRFALGDQRVTNLRRQWRERWARYQGEAG